MIAIEKEDLLQLMIIASRHCKEQLHDFQDIYDRLNSKWVKQEFEKHVTNVEEKSQ